MNCCDRLLYAAVVCGLAFLAGFAVLKFAEAALPFWLVVPVMAIVVYGGGYWVCTIVGQVWKEDSR